MIDWDVYQVSFRWKYKENCFFIFIRLGYFFFFDQCRIVYFGNLNNLRFLCMFLRFDDYRDDFRQGRECM